MQVETKYNKDDVVWFMQDNKPCKNMVDSFQINCKYTGGPNDRWGSDSYSIRVRYYLTDSAGKVFHMEESELFDTKEKLINSL